MIRGDPTLERKVVEPRALCKMNEVEAWLLVWEFGSLEAKEDKECWGLTEGQVREMEMLLS